MSVQTQEAFVAERRQSWTELEHALHQESELHHREPADISQMASLYRSVCADLMRARVAYTPELVRYLDGLAGRAHNVFYGSRTNRLVGLWTLLARDFPSTLRKRWRLFALASALFYVPFVLGLLGTLMSVDFAETILPVGQLAEMESMYEQGFDAGRDINTNSKMAGFYVLNNVGIAFRCFGTGVLLGIGSLFFTLYNGLVMGVNIGWVFRAGHGVNITTFICGHGPFELTAIVISAAAGLQMGWALVDTGGLTRLASLRAQAGELGHLIVGAAAMLVIAACIEGFWSPSGVPAPIKWTASLLFSAGIVAWLTLGGRRRAGAREATP